MAVAFPNEIRSHQCTRHFILPSNVTSNVTRYEYPGIQTFSPAMLTSKQAVSLNTGAFHALDKNTKFTLTLPLVY